MRKLIKSSYEHAQLLIIHKNERGQANSIGKTNRRGEHLNRLPNRAGKNWFIIMQQSM